MQQQLDKKIKKLGPSIKAIETNSSSAVQKRSQAERDQLMEKLLQESEAEGKSAEQYQQHDNGEGTGSYYVQLEC